MPPSADEYKPIAEVMQQIPVSIYISFAELRQSCANGFSRGSFG